MNLLIEPSWEDAIFVDIIIRIPWNLSRLIHQMGSFLWRITSFLSSRGNSLLLYTGVTFSSILAESRGAFCVTRGLFNLVGTLRSPPYLIWTESSTFWRFREVQTRSSDILVRSHEILRWSREDSTQSCCWNSSAFPRMLVNVARTFALLTRFYRELNRLTCSLSRGWLVLLEFSAFFTSFTFLARCRLTRSRLFHQVSWFS